MVSASQAAFGYAGFFVRNQRTEIREQRGCLGLGMPVGNFLWGRGFKGADRSMFARRWLCDARTQFTIPGAAPPLCFLSDQRLEIGDHALMRLAVVKRLAS